jgi:hypothetical protein
MQANQLHGSLCELDISVQGGRQAALTEISHRATGLYISAPALLMNAMEDCLHTYPRRDTGLRYTFVMESSSWMPEDEIGRICPEAGVYDSCSIYAFVCRQ